MQKNYVQEILNIIHDGGPQAEMAEKLSDYHEKDLADALEVLTHAERKALYPTLGVDEVAEIYGRQCRYTVTGRYDPSFGGRKPDVFQESAAALERGQSRIAERYDFGSDGVGLFGLLYSLFQRLRLEFGVSAVWLCRSSTHCCYGCFQPGGYIGSDAVP